MPEMDFDTLKSVPVRPLPAAEVRRLGERHRARRRAAVAAGATLATVAVVAVVGLVLGAGSGDRAVQPIGTPTSTAPVPVVMVPGRSLDPAPSTPGQPSGASDGAASGAATAPGTDGAGSPATTDDGSAAAGAWSTDLLPTATDLIEGGETTTPWRAGPIGSSIPADWLRPCRGDATDAPVRPGYIRAAWRDFTPLRPTMGAAAQGQAVLLDYPTQSAAQAAYQDLSDAYAGCAAVIRADGRTDVSKVTRTDIDLGAFSSGPNAAEASGFMLTYPDAAAHAVTELQHGIAIDGSHLLVLTITQDTQDYWPDLQNSMPTVVERFGRTTGLPRTLVSPTQVDYVRLGESYQQAMAGGGLTRIAESGVSGWALRPYAAVQTGADGSTTILGQVCVTPRDGVTTMWMPEQVTTPEGIGTGSTEAQVRAAYPDVTTDPDGYLDHTLWGGADAAEYHFGIQGGKVSEWAVTNPHDACYG